MGSKTKQADDHRGTLELDRILRHLDDIDLAAAKAVRDCNPLPGIYRIWIRRPPRLGFRPGRRTSVRLLRRQ